MKHSIYIFFAVLLLSCTRDNPDFLGGSLNDQFGELVVLDSLAPNTSSFNFSLVSPRFFEAQWSKNLNWELNIVGQESGASKQFSGFDNKLDIENSSWDGSSSDFPSFRKESCDITLVLIDNADTIQMVSTVNLSELKPTQDGVKVVADFEDGLPTNTIVFEQSGADFGILEGFAAKGSSYYKMGGYVPYDYLLGSMKIPVDMQDFEGVSPLLLYFNMATIGGLQGEVPNNQFIKIVIRENDADNISQGETYSIEINPISWSNWQLFSLPYSDFTLENGVNNVQEPEKINQIEILCLSCPAESAPDPNAPICAENTDLIVKTDIDFIAFTRNESYRP